MPDILNALDVNIATIGNHDLGEYRPPLHQTRAPS